MQCFRDDWLSMTVGTSKFTIREIIESSAWPKRKAQTKPYIRQSRWFGAVQGFAEGN
jgi:hypothetical protein